MRRIRIAGLCLVAVFALGAIVSGTASAAAPEFGQCLKKAVKSLPGYSDSKCTKEATEAKKGTYEWVPCSRSRQKRVHDQRHHGDAGHQKWYLRDVLSEKSSGEYLVGGNNKQESTTVEFAGCVSSGFKCTTAGKAEGELVTNELIGEVGFENKAAKKTALKLEPAASAKGKFITFKCVGLEVAVRGKGEEKGAGILVNIKNDTMTATETLKYKATKGVQKPVKWEGPNPKPTSKAVSKNCPSNSRVRP